MDDDTPTIEFAAIPSQHTSRRPAFDLALTVGAVLGVLCIAATVVSLTLGVRPVVFETGSMAPAISTGSLGLSRTVAATDVHAGDVVGVVRDDGVRVTHRVESIDSIAGNSVTMTLRGDANAKPDPQTYVVTSVTRVYGTVPVLGYVAIWLKNPYTLALQGLGVLALLAIAFAPKQGWRNTPAAQRLVVGTAAVSVIALAASGTHGSGDAQAALTGTATATGTVNAGRPANPTSFTCTNSTIILFSTVTLSWPNPGDPRYSYVLMSGSTVVATIPPTSNNPVTYQISQGLLTSIINIITGNNGEITLYQKIGDFQSASGLTQALTTTLIPLGARCRNPGTVTGPANLQARNAGPSGSASSSVPPSESSSSSSAAPSSPSSTESSSASAAPEPSTSESSATPAPTTEEKPELPAGGTPSGSGSFAYYQSGGTVTIRNASSTVVEYTGSFSPSSTVQWVSGSDALKITDTDGTVTTLTRSGSTWIPTVTPPPAPEVPQAPAQPAPQAPAEPAPESDGPG